jgi:hypothetical protein
VALAVLPQTVSNATHWRQWLERLVAKPIPAAVRFLIVDHANDSQFAELKNSQPEIVAIIRPDLKVGLGYLELLREVPGTGPGFIFRRFFVALGSAISCGNFGAARRLADQATQIASQQKWTHLQSVVAMTLGAAYLQQQDFEAAIKCFVNGQTAVAGQSDIASAKVGIQAKLAEASALLAASRPADAAAVYHQVQGLAKQAGDSFAEFESTRMAAYCHELAGQKEEARKNGLATLALAEAMKSQSAPAATLPYAGQALLRVADGSAKDTADIRRRLEGLLGKNWDAVLHAETPS